MDAKDLLASAYAFEKLYTRATKEVLETRTERLVKALVRIRAYASDELADPVDAAGTLKDIIAEVAKVL